MTDYGRCIRSIAVISPISLALAGCAGVNGSVGITRPVTVKSQDRAGTVLLSATMVAPWSEVSAALKPAFTMTGDTAVTEVMPTTATIQEETLHATSLAAAVSSPGAGTATAPTGTPLSATLPAAAALGAVALDPAQKYRAAADLLEQLQLLNQEIDHVAARDGYVPYVVKYKLAVVTYQAHMAYSAHTRITLFPPEANQQTSAQSPATLPSQKPITGLLSYPDNLPDPTAPAGSGKTIPGTRTVSGTFTLDASHQITPPTYARTPVIVPLLVADDLNVALKSQAAQSAQQLALALNVLAHGVSGSASLNHVAEALKAVNEQDLTSTLTVTREADDTLYAVVQPNNLATGDPSLVTKTYDIAVLVLIPRDYFVQAGAQVPALVNFSTTTEFRNVLDGSVLRYNPDKFDKNYDPMVKDFVHYDDLSIWKNYSLKYKAKYMRALIMKYGESDDFDAFHHDIFNGNGVKFYKNEKHIPGNGKFSCDSTSEKGTDCIKFMVQGARPLWSLMKTTANYSPYQSGSFQAPIPSPITIPGQKVLLVDDGTQSITAQVGGITGGSAASLTAFLIVSRTVAVKPAALKRKGVKSVDPILFEEPVQSAVLDPTTHVLTLTAASIKKLGILPDLDADNYTVTDTYHVRFQKAYCNNPLMLCADLAVNHSSIDTELAANTLPAAYFVKSGPLKGITLQPGNGGLAINGASGTLQVFVADFPAGDTTAGLTVTGADVLSVTTAAGTALAAPTGDNGFVLPSAGQYAINLVNLSPGTPFTVKVSPLKGGAPDAAQASATGSYNAVENVSSAANASYTAILANPPAAPARAVAHTPRKTPQPAHPRGSHAAGKAVH